MRSLSLLSALFLSLASLHRLTGAQEAGAVKNQPSFLPQSFFFDWTTSAGEKPVPLQIVEQCDNLAISWARGAATGPDPIAPYSLQIYTSSYVFPLIVDAGSGPTFKFPVPFNPGTQFQICMFDKKGHPGGCQRSMYVYPSLTSSNPVCTNLTYPQYNQWIDVAVTRPSGEEVSQYGWPSQCEEHSFKPRNGTPPYTLTVAPSLHPPWNITSNDQSPINWTIALSWGSLFYVSVVDSVGNLWANGPLHAGSGATGCLSNETAMPNDSDKKDNQVSTYVAVGSGIGGLVAGLLIGLLGVLVVHRHFKKNRQGGMMRQGSFDSVPNRDEIAPFPHTSYRDHTDHTAQTLLGVGSLGRLNTDSSYKVEPFVPPPTPSVAGRESSVAGLTGDGSTTGPNEQRQSRPGNVYVVHHDAGRAPVTVYTDGAQVVELPPEYDQESQAAASSSRRLPQPQRRMPGAVRKPEANTEGVNSPDTNPGSS